ncbi:MAG: zinc carboxypeptidase [Cyclobacteriaceae bacterium]|nr:zinc carboxypeptidase [Cyclobacteriaceae bacterium]
MKRTLFLAACMVLINLFVRAQTDLSLTYYFKEEVQFDSSVPTPEEVLGFQVGEWHVSHDKLVEYMKAVASASERVSLEVTGYTYEHRPLLLLTITNAENRRNLERIKKDHISLTDPSVSNKINIEDMPVVVWLGHSIHGNEASGSNASLLMIYYLAAAQGDEIDELLKNAVILFDPSYNPDGLNRFASWVNSHKSKILDPNSSSLEHNEAWPRGRTNHYWFDVNRDWLPVQQPETKARITKFYEWRPNILTDQHEMGTNGTYFFQPGIPTRNNPYVPAKGVELTTKIAQYHAKAMDKIGSLYYTEESYDDYYPGKGSTFPDLNGSIGILFEQASARGHVQESDNGPLTFPFAIRNHVTTSLSTLQAAIALRKELLIYQRDFYTGAANLASNDYVKAYIFSGSDDYNKTHAFFQILGKHHIQVNSIDNSYSKFQQDKSYVVSLNQPQYRLIKTIFEKNTSFEDSLFYDVSAWTLPLAFGLAYEELDAKQLSRIKIGQTITDVSLPQLKVERSQYGYLLLWDDYLAPAALNEIQEAGIRTKLATHAFRLNNEAYKPGTILVPLQNQIKSEEEIYKLVFQVSEKYHVRIDGVDSGNANGVRLGSPSFELLEKRNIVVVAGDGLSSYEVGEVWHLFDQRMDVPMSLVSIDVLNRDNLGKYNTMVMVNGNYNRLDANKLRDWVAKGGLIVATKSAGKWLADQKISNVHYLENKPDSTVQRPYELMDRYEGAQVIGGAIFATEVDRTNPLLYGLNSSSVPVFRNSTLMMERAKNAYANPIVYTGNPLLSGYISKENLQRLRNTAAVQIDSMGKGKIITFTDNPNFREFWYGTNRLFLNAVFFGSVIRTR